MQIDYLMISNSEDQVIYTPEQRISVRIESMPVISNISRNFVFESECREPILINGSKLQIYYDYFFGN